MLYVKEFYLSNLLRNTRMIFIAPLYIFLYYNQADAQYIKFILFWNNALYVSDGLSVHHQESRTVHTASGICHTEISKISTSTSECVYVQW